jgi:hypothetical protein
VEIIETAGKPAEDEPAPFLLRFMERSVRVPERSNTPYSDDPTYMGPTGGPKRDYESD